jgi:hypothetical protein
MSVYRIYRLKESVRQQFRWAPHTIGITAVKQKDYEQVHSTEGSGPYAVWIELKDSDSPLQVGDILESDDGQLRIYKYVGFEEAQWHVVEAKPPTDTTSEPRGQVAAQ